jgi:hypothetical protein
LPKPEKAGSKVIPLALKGVDLDRIENETRIDCTHSRPEKPPACENCGHRAELFGWLGKLIRINSGTQNAFDLAGDQSSLPALGNEAAGFKNSFFSGFGCFDLGQSHRAIEPILQIFHPQTNYKLQY